MLATQVLAAGKCCRCCDYSIQYSPDGSCKECPSGTSDLPGFSHSWDFATCKTLPQDKTLEQKAKTCISKCQSMMLTGTAPTVNPKTLEVCKESIEKYKFKPPTKKIPTCCQCVDLVGQDIGVGEKPQVSYSHSGKCTMCKRFGVLATIAVSNVMDGNAPMVPATSKPESQAKAKVCGKVFAGTNGEPAMMIKTYAWTNDDLEVMATYDEGLSFQTKLGAGAVALSILSIAFLMRSYNKSSKVNAVYEVLNDEI